MIYAAAGFFALFVAIKLSQFIEDSMCGFDIEGEYND